MTQRLNSKQILDLSLMDSNFSNGANISLSKVENGQLILKTNTSLEFFTSNFNLNNYLINNIQTGDKELKDIVNLEELELKKSYPYLDDIEAIVNDNSYTQVSITNNLRYLIRDSSNYPLNIFGSPSNLVDNSIISINSQNNYEVIFSFDKYPSSEAITFYDKTTDERYVLKKEGDIRPLFSIETFNYTNGLTVEEGTLSIFKGGGLLVEDDLLKLDINTDYLYFDDSSLNLSGIDSSLMPDAVLGLGLKEENDVIQLDLANITFNFNVSGELSLNLLNNSKYIINSFTYDKLDHNNIWGSGLTFDGSTVSAHYDSNHIIVSLPNKLSIKEGIITKEFFDDDIYGEGFSKNLDSEFTLKVDNLSIGYNEIFNYYEALLDENLNENGRIVKDSHGLSWEQPFLPFGNKFLIDGNGLSLFKEIVQEIPSPLPNNSTQEFTVDRDMISGTDCVYLDGLLLQEGVDYFVSSANTISLTVPPSNSQILKLNYWGNPTSLEEALPLTAPSIPVLPGGTRHFDPIETISSGRYSSYGPANTNGSFAPLITFDSQTYTWLTESSQNYITSGSDNSWVTSNSNYSILNKSSITQVSSTIQFFYMDGPNGYIESTDPNFSQFPNNGSFKGDTVIGAGAQTFLYGLTLFENHFLYRHYSDNSLRVITNINTPTPGTVTLPYLGGTDIPRTVSAYAPETEYFYCAYFYDTNTTNFESEYRKFKLDSVVNPSNVIDYQNVGSTELSLNDTNKRIPVYFNGYVYFFGGSNGDIDILNPLDDSITSITPKNLFDLENDLPIAPYDYTSYYIHIWESYGVVQALLYLPYSSNIVLYLKIT